MPPKKAANNRGEGADNTAAGAVTILCHLIMGCDDFKSDNAKLAPILGIAQAKNVPRKINSIVNPYGFDFKGGKIVSQSGSQGQDGAAGASDDTGAAEDGKDDKAVKKPPRTRAPRPNVKARRGTAKKRKLSVSDDDSDRVKDEDGQGV